MTDKKFKSSFTYIWALSLTIKECGMLNHSLNRLYLKLHHLSLRVELFLLLSLEDRIPILTFSEKYVELGALISIGIDAFDIGRQAAEMANSILSGRNGGGMKPVDAQKAVLSVNLKIARKLGIRIDEKIVEHARVVD